MASVASVDGTTIYYDIAGSGPVIVFVAGGRGHSLAGGPSSWLVAGR
jgi:hypothetical protein